MKNDILKICDIKGWNKLNHTFKVAFNVTLKDKSYYSFIK